MNTVAKKQSGKKRTQVQDLPEQEKKLSAREMKNVQGGNTVGGKLKPLEGDPDQPIVIGSIRP